MNGSFIIVLQVIIVFKISLYARRIGVAVLYSKILMITDWLWQFD